MRVNELIEILQKLPQDLNVWVSEGGYVEGAMPVIKNKFRRFRLNLFKKKFR